MFGSPRGQPLKLVPFTQAKPRTFGPLLCDGLSARNLGSFAELLALHARLQAEHPGQRVLASLDDLGQASYTSGHATDHHGLDDIEGHDLSGLRAEAFENGEHRGYLSTPAEFPIRLANLLERAREIRLEHVAGVLDWETSGDGNDLVTINQAPEAALRIAQEKEVLFQVVPVGTAAQAIAAFPNGYFSADLDPMQTYVLARRLEDEYDLSLFGIGARMLGFRRPAALPQERARALGEELAALYAGAPPKAAEALARLLTGRDWLLLRYTES
ncbi:hypothetical protein [Caulobacter rhizosphaerae]|jgi:hypothetical protein|uniref:hypothetical protein n=1 Tax=Caulobacter rhizosphaerae TaxID=2010972 RepID=UPI0013D6B07E|nr:hypothetical protein [Caulobacter rhizosphaerae]GGL39499.1 hypothetical protein GCM10010983_40700 [Caulobacter rhizosphaerae]